MNRCRSSNGRPGYILGYLVLVLSALTVVILTGAAFRASRLRSAHQAYLDAAALSLAQGGVEAAASAIRRRSQLPEQPLGDSIDLTGATGRLTIESSRSAAGRVAVTACSTVTSTRLHIGEARRCVEATFADDDPPRLMSWHER